MNWFITLLLCYEYLLEYLDMFCLWCHKIWTGIYNVLLNKELITTTYWKYIHETFGRKPSTLVKLQSRKCLVQAICEQQQLTQKWSGTLAHCISRWWERDTGLNRGSFSSISPHIIPELSADNYPGINLSPIR